LCISTIKLFPFLTKPKKQCGRSKEINNENVF
jgi:hypothetical protein